MDIDPEETAVDTEARKQVLLDRLAALRSRAMLIEATLDEARNPDFAEAAVEREGDEVLEDLGVAAVQEVRRIEAALERIAEGTYGICVGCGDEISEARLDALPETPLCRACAA